MDEISKKWIEDDVKSALRLCSIWKWVKIALAIIICIAYLIESSWLSEILIVSVLVLLFLPLGFFDAFFQKLLEYNIQLIEDRQVLNAKEVNKHFEEAFQRISDLEHKVGCSR